MLIGEHGTDEADRGAVVREDPDDVGAAFPSCVLEMPTLAPIPYRRSADDLISCALMDTRWRAEEAIHRKLGVGIASFHRRNLDFCRISRFVRLSLVVAVVATVAACTSDGRSSEVLVCRAADGESLVEEHLSPDTPSSTFRVGVDGDVWVAVIADGDVSGSALFSRVTGLFVIDEGDPVDYTRDSTGGVVTDAPYLDFDEQGQFVPLEVEPGAYQLWSTKSPEVQVVRCPTSSS